MCQYFFMIYSCTLPFPPSVNSAYGGGSGQRRFKSKQYKAWEKECPQLVLPECGAVDWPVSITYDFYMPDKRRRDIGNYEKVLTDMLVTQCILMEDNTKIVRQIILNYVGVDRDKPRVEIFLTNL